MQKNRIWCNRTLYSIASVMVCQGTAAFAQETPTESIASDTTVQQEQEQEILVTAQRRSQRLQDVPIAVSVVSGDALEKSGINNLEDMSVRLPNVRLAPAPASDILTVRGVGSGINLGFEQSVATFVDGVYRSRSKASRAALFDVEQVEILRGPQTTFFGNNAIAGALNISTKKPTRELSYNITALGSDQANEYSLEAGVSGSLSDTLSVRAATKFSGMDGYIKNVRLNEVGPNTSDKLGRVAFAWEPSTGVRVDARFDIGRMRGTGVYNVELLNCPPPPEFGGPRGACSRYLNVSGGTVDQMLNYRTVTSDSFLDYDYEEVALNAEIEIGKHNLALTSGYFHHSFDHLFDLVPTLGGSLVGTVPTFPLREQEGYRFYSQEVRLESAPGGPVEYMAGAYYAWSQFEIDSGFGLFFAPLGAFAPGVYTPGTPIQVAVNNFQRDKTVSLFGSMTLRPISDVRLNLGLRYSNVSKNAQRTAKAGTGSQDVDPDLFLAGPSSVQAVLLARAGADIGDYEQPSRRDTKLMPSVGIEYDITANAMTYATYTNGFKAGGYAAQFSTSDFDPEVVDAVEVGFKSTSFGGRLTLNLAGFLSKYSNLQEATNFVLPSGAIRNIVDNVARSTAKGVEFNGLAQLGSGFRLSFDLAYLKSKYDAYPSAPCTSLGSLTPGCAQDLSGKRRSYAPKFSGNLGLSWRGPISNSIDLSVEGNTYFTTQFFQQATADPLMVQRGYAKVDSRIALSSSDGEWEVALLGRNLTNKVTASFRNTVPTATGSVAALTERPRSVAIQFSLKR